MLKTLILGIIRQYQLYISPLLGRHCRYYPSCSCYLQEAISQYGVLRGAFKGLSRIVRCHPFSPGGLDPIIK